MRKTGRARHREPGFNFLTDLRGLVPRPRFRVGLLLAGLVLALSGCWGTGNGPARPGPSPPTRPDPDHPPDPGAGGPGDPGAVDRGPNADPPAPGRWRGRQRERGRLGL